MKKITGTLLLNCYAAFAFAQSGSLPEDGDILRHLGIIIGKWMPYIALLTGLIAILLNSRQSRRLSKLKKYIDEQRLKVSGLQEDIRKKVNRTDLDNLMAKEQATPDKVAGTEQPYLEKVWEMPKKSATSVVNIESAVQVTAPEEPEHCVFYAKLADLDDGFSAAVMDSQQNGEQIYEIKVEGETAAYGISTDPNAQKYALAEFTFTLGKACELLNQPFKGCQIILQREGTLVKIAGNWIIQQKAQIEFK